MSEPGRGEMGGVGDFVKDTDEQVTEKTDTDMGLDVDTDMGDETVVDMGVGGGEGKVKSGPVDTDMG